MTQLYIISYDLRKPGQDYATLFNALRRKGAKRVLKSQWALKDHKGKAIALRDELKRDIDTNDRLLVTEVGHWAGYNLMFNLNTL